MWMGAFFAVLAALLWGGYWVIFGHEAKVEQSAAQYRSFASNMMVLQTAASSYLNANYASLTPGSMTPIAVAGAVSPAPRVTPDPGFTLPAWFVPAGPWRVVWGKDPADLAGPVSVIATYWPPNGSTIYTFEPVKLAVGLGEVTGGSLQAGIATSDGRVSSSGAETSNLQTFPVPFDNAGQPLVPEGSAVVVSRRP